MKQWINSLLFSIIFKTKFIFDFKVSFLFLKFKTLFIIIYTYYLGPNVGNLYANNLDKI
jgi:hypothetical protein